MKGVKWILECLASGPRELFGISNYKLCISGGMQVC